MTGVCISSISPRMLTFKDQAKQTQNHTELVDLRYSSITWPYIDGNLIFKYDWNELSF
ncbi:Type VI secretion system effector, Hcp1 family (fragment) [Paraburkholderia piptadeniae]|uniref:Type VI secretion system effector, Hcp1 family n=2 Tax=Paraburkholderia piptadeniae TaxID=1701573 RepID=A0A1N7RXH6_9BURK